jgi:outer membrane assembly lipoprotein YfiO
MVRYLVLCFVLLGTWGCPQKSAKLQKSVVPPDKTLFETGSDYLKKSQYIKARLAFQTLINTYPDSEMAAESYLSIGDSFYDEGGTENLLQAEDQYKNFIVFFPANPKAPEAQMKIISANMKMMRTPDRDPQYSFKSEQAIKDMLQKFPDSDFAPIAKQLLIEVQENLAQSDWGVGKWYEDHNNPAGAVGRYKSIVTKYQQASFLDEVYMRLANMLEKSNNPDEAAIYLGKVVSGFPFSKRSDEAKEKLKSLGKQLPPVDTQTAALNQARIKPAEGFSPLKPFIDFGKALGFAGVPDRYEEAKKAIEAEKIRTAAAEAAKTGEGGQKGDDILIETVLKKSADGETQASTVLGSSANSASQNGEEAKKVPSKVRKKNPKKQ